MRDTRFAGRVYGKIVVPVAGAFFGADDTWGFTGATGIEGRLGRTMAIRNRHNGWGSFTDGHQQISLALQEKQDAQAGTVPMLSVGGQGWPQDGSGLQQIASGALDAQIGALVSAYEAIGTGWIFRPMMEMNGAHNAGYYGNPALFIEAWTRIAEICRVEAPNAVLVFCPQQTSTGGGDPAAWQAYAPSVLAYDWGGVDLYRATFDHALPFLDYYVANGKPFIVCESGFEQGKVVKDPAGVKYDKDGSVTGQSLILHTRDQVKAEENCIAYLVWNDIGPMGDDLVNTSPTSLTHYRIFAQDPYFAAR